MLRQIISIDQDKCDGCGACAAACHEGAIAMVEGKARLMREDYCDGLGDCLPACPRDAISFQQREAAAYDAEAVAAAKARGRQGDSKPLGGCPGAKAKAIQREAAPSPLPQGGQESQLRQWPVQIKLAPEQAAFYQDCHLLIAADCTAYAYAAFHQDFIRGRVALIGCPKLDGVDYSEKLTRIIAANRVQSLTIVRMQVPCCGGLENAAKAALQASGKFIPWQVVTISTDGRII